MTVPEILQEAKKLDQEARQLKKEILQMCWHMRGLSYSEGMSLGFEERQIISEMIKEHLETTKKSGLPFF